MAASTKWAWSLSNLIHIESAAEPVEPRGFWAIAAVAILVSLLFHAVIIWLVLQQGVIAVLPRPPESVTLVRLPLPIVPPKPVPRPVPKPVPVVKAPKLRVIVRHQETPRPRPAAPVVNHFAAATDNGLNLNLAPPPSGTGHGNMGVFDDAVKQDIIAHKTYPPGMKGMWMECVVSYRVTVDRNGALLSYNLFGCGNPFLDSAARAAILLASPFPVPPDFGGSQYTVYGSLVYKHR